MSAPEIKGYCPGALRPMMSGDGLVVRIRPYNGCLSRAQVSGIAALSQTHGNGIIDLSSRANVQLRGVAPDGHAALIEGLRDLGLIDPSEAIESRRNIVVTPFWTAGDPTETMAQSLTQALSRSNAPALPHKFGFAIDTGPTPVLQSCPADIRLERTFDGTLLLVADGMTTGMPVTAENSIEQALSFADWFMSTRTAENRMAKVLQSTSPPDGFSTPRQPPADKPAVGMTPQGALCGFAFGQVAAETLAELAQVGDLRITPWRMILIQGACDLPRIDGLITDPKDPLLGITACTGAPACSQAQGETRQTARALASWLKPQQTLHISGCAKGCAHPKAAPITLTATPQGFDLVKQGRAGDTPALTALSTDDIIKVLSNAP
jgi:precorrin-3B synthase